MKKKKRLSIRKITIFLLLLVVVIGGCVLAFNKVSSGKKTTKEVQDVDSIEGYNYTLKDNATKYYKSLFEELKKTLEADEIDEEKYAELVAQMFVADFFNLDNKISKSDVGGTQFVYSDYVNDFSKYASDSMYKSVDSDGFGDRDQDLPVVAKVTVENKGNETYTYGENTDENAYRMSFEIEYDDDLGYQTSGELIIIHNGNKLEVASMSEGSSE